MKHRVGLLSLFACALTACSGGGEETRGPAAGDTPGADDQDTPRGGASAQSLSLSDGTVPMKVKVVVGDALRALPLLPGRYDFVLIDAAKDDYLDYLRQLEPKLADGAVIVADNAGVFRRAVGPYLEHVRRDPRYTSREVPVDDDAMEVSVFRRSVH